VWTAPTCRRGPPDGTKIACVVTRYDAGSQTETSGILVMGADGSRPEFVTRSSEIDEHPIWSPDGGKIAFLRKTPDGYVDVFVASAVGGSPEPTKLSDPDVHVTSPPNWTPDSQEVLFSTQRVDNDSHGIYVVSSDGTGERVLLEDAYARGAVRSPDGRWIAFVRDDAGSGHVAIWLLRPDGTDLTDVASGLEAAGDIAWQPLTT
jgi:TolB protein